MTIELAATTATPDEVSLLAACMNGFDPRDTGITAEDFDEPKHSKTWNAMISILDSGKQIDPATVVAQLGDPSLSVWVLDLYGAPVTPANAPAFAARVRRAADMRNLQDLARAIMQRSLTDGTDPGELANWVRDRLDVPTGAIRDTVTFADITSRLIARFESGKQSGLSTPWPELDAKIHGLSPSRLYVIAGRPGGGKSLAGQNIAWHWSRRHRQPVYFATLEMEAEEIGERQVAQIAQISLDTLQSGRLDPGEAGMAYEALRTMRDAPIHMCVDSAQTLDMIRNGARRLKRRHGLGLVVVDYLQLVRPRDPRMPRREQVDEIARGLKLMAKELQVPVVAMTQLNREATKDKGRPPVLSDLRESGEIEQAADVVILLHRPDLDDPTHGQMLVAKARNGSMGQIDVTMRTWFASINSAERFAS